LIQFCPLLWSLVQVYYQWLIFGTGFGYELECMGSRGSLMVRAWRF